MEQQHYSCISGWGVCRCCFPLVFFPVISAPHGASCCPRCHVLRLCWKACADISVFFKTHPFALGPRSRVASNDSSEASSFPSLTNGFLDLFSIQPSPIFPSPFDSFTILSYFVKVFFVVAAFLVRVYSVFFGKKGSLAIIFLHTLY